MKTDDYQEIIVESYIRSTTTGKRGKIHIRPVIGQSPFSPNMLVECKELFEKFDIGTKFKICAKVTSRNRGTPFVYRPYFEI